MITHIANVFDPAHFGYKPQQNTSAPHQVTNDVSGRKIEDKIDLSIEARQTLEERRQAQKEEQNRLTEEILDKGFRGWAEEYHREKIEAEVRAQVLKSFGYDEESYSKLETEVQQRIEEIISAKIREKIQQEVAKNIEEENSASDTKL